MGWRDTLRALIDGDEPDEVEDEVEADEAADEVEDEVEGDEVADEVEGDEIEAEADEAADEDEVEGTPGDEASESPREAELAAQVIAQAEQIETLRNRLAAAGLDDSVDEVVETVEDEVDDTIEDDAVAAFDSDYAEREARLAEIKEN